MAPLVWDPPSRYRTRSLPALVAAYGMAFATAGGPAGLVCKRVLTCVRMGECPHMRRLWVGRSLQDVSYSRAPGGDVGARRSRSSRARAPADYVQPSLSLCIMGYATHMGIYAY